MNVFGTARPLASFFCLILPTVAAAQVQPIGSRPDTMRVDLDPIVVTAERFAQQLGESTAAIAKLDREDIERLPAKSLTDVIALMPGIGFINRDGDGRDGLVTVRGFYGGGDVEYLVVLVDGLPVNDMESGLVAWESIPTVNIERIELLRGGSSSLYGDAAIGGVLNIITRRATATGGRVSLSAGSFSSFSGSVGAAEVVGSIPVRLSADYRSTEGFRPDKPRKSGTVNVGADLLNEETWKLSVRSANSWRLIDTPGPLLSTPGEDQDYITAAFSGDYLDERRNSLSVEATGRSGTIAWRSSVSGLLRHTDSRGTLALAPQFADTRDRVLDGQRVTVSGGVNYSGSAFSIVAGFDAGVNRYESSYYSMSADNSSDGTPLRGDLDEMGKASRQSIGAYVQAEVRPIEQLAITAGVRTDGLWDSFTPEGPSEGEDLSTTHTAVSPKLGANISVIKTESARLNLFATAGTSFKAPAIDQLYGQRNITVLTEFGPFDVSTSNGDLKPQRGSHVEGGAYASLLGDLGRIEGSVTIYRIDMRDELDVDLATFQLVNIGRSRHDGAELGLNLYHPSGVGILATYTLQSTTFRNGDYSGNFVKAIPRDLYSAGITDKLANGLGFGATAHGRRRTYIDDTNTEVLQDYVAVDARVSFESGPLRVSVDGLNLLDEDYDTTGYPDPFGSDEQFLYPAAGRSARVAVAYGW